MLHIFEVDYTEYYKIYIVENYMNFYGNSNYSGQSRIYEGIMVSLFEKKKSEN